MTSSSERPAAALALASTATPPGGGCASRPPKPAFANRAAGAPAAAARRPRRGSAHRPRPAAVALARAANTTLRWLRITPRLRRPRSRRGRAGDRRKRYAVAPLYSRTVAQLRRVTVSAPDPMLPNSLSGRLSHPHYVCCDPCRAHNLLSAFDRLPDRFFDFLDQSAEEVLRLLRLHYVHQLLGLLQCREEFGGFRPADTQYHLLGR